VRGRVARRLSARRSGVHSVWAAPLASTCRLRFDVTPASAEVFVDGVKE